MLLHTYTTYFLLDQTLVCVIVLSILQIIQNITYTGNVISFEETFVNIVINQEELFWAFLSFLCSL